MIDEKRPSAARVFFSIRPNSIYLIIFLVLSSAVSGGRVYAGDTGYGFSMNLGERYRLVERHNLRVRENGVYRGFLYREFRAFLRNPGMDEGRYEGEYYILENMKRNAALIAKAVDDEYKASFSLTRFGIMDVPRDSVVPVHRDFPAFSPDPVAEGDSWDVSGSDLVFDSRGNSVRVPFLCHYVYRDRETYMGRPVAVIDARYAIRYDEGTYGYSAGTIRKVSGSRKAVIMFYLDEPGGIFINSQIKQRIVYSGGNTEDTEGFILTWYNGISASAVEASDSRIVRSLNRIREEESGSPGSEGKLLDGVSVARSEKGLVLNIENIHFLPNSPVILPEEKGRLDSIASVLKEAEGRTFLVTGHTADVGSLESQKILSVKRAKTIVDELVKRGIAPGRFMYEGKGGSEPVASNDTKEGRARNRRVEITILD